MNFLGLDLSFTATGFYLIKEDGNNVSFEINTKPHEYPDDLSRSEHIAEYIISQIKDVPLEFIALEDYFAGQQASSVLKLAILGTVIRCVLLKHGYPYIAFSPTQIKKFETGSGIAPKDTMLKSVFKKHGFDTMSNNVADACAIAYMGKGYYEWKQGKRDFLKYEAEVLKNAIKDRIIVYPYTIDLSKIHTKGV